ncbi:glycosyltransferase family 2 protein [Wenyingzhuangia sp. IMCC45533]
MNKLGIITPHHNNFKGLEKIYSNLLSQTSPNWEWVIVDDFSDTKTQSKVSKFFVSDNRVTVVLNNFKSSASQCRNMGVDYATADTIVFLDSDDRITETFVENRTVKVEDFTIYLRCMMVSSENGKERPFSNITDKFLDNFLKAKFAWQTTCVLWEKFFLESIGKFNENLELLEDIELSIRALLISEKFKIEKDNELDFYYKVEPINVEKRTVKKINKAVEYLINSLTENYDNLTKQQLGYLSNYYFLLVKYFCRAKNKQDLMYLKRILNLLSVKNIINYREYLYGITLVILFKYNFLSYKHFLNINRLFFKKT